MVKFNNIFSAIQTLVKLMRHLLIIEIKTQQLVTMMRILFIISVTEVQCSDINCILKYEKKMKSLILQSKQDNRLNSWILVSIFFVRGWKCWCHSIKMELIHDSICKRLLWKIMCPPHTCKRKIIIVEKIRIAVDREQMETHQVVSSISVSGSFIAATYNNKWNKN